MHCWCRSRSASTRFRRSTTYVAMQRGQPKRKESLKWFIDYIAGMKAKYGKIYVRFAEPVALSDTVPVSEAMLTSDAGRAQVQKLAFEVCSRIENAKPINPTDLVTLVLLAAQGRGLDCAQIAGQAADIVDLIEARGLPTAGDLRIAMGEGLQAKLDALSETGLLESFEAGAAPVYRIISRPAARCGVLPQHDRALLPVERDCGGRARDVARRALPGMRRAEAGADYSRPAQVRVLLQGEGRVPATMRPTTSTAGMAHGRNGDLRTRYRCSAPEYCVPSSRLTGYSRCCSRARGSEVIDEDDRAALVGGCLARGEEMLRRKEISTETALAQPMFETADPARRLPWPARGRYAEELRVGPAGVRQRNSKT